MVVKTRHPVNRKILQQNTVATTANGLPVDSVVEIHDTHRLIQNTTTPISYSDPTVTVDPSVNLAILKNFKPRYTGNLIFLDSTGETYYIDRNSVDTTAGTFDIFVDPSYTASPSSIDTLKGWLIAEAKLVNKMSVSTAAHIDEVHFNGFDINLQLNGTTDTISVINPVTGVPININPDGSIDVNVNVDADDGDDIAISRHQFPFKRRELTSKTKAQLSTVAYTQLFTYTAAQDGLRIRKITAYGDTFGTFRVKVNGIVEDIFRTSNTERNALFEFLEDLDVLNGQAVTVEFRPDRNRLNSYEFFYRMEGYYKI